MFRNRHINETFVINVSGKFADLENISISPLEEDSSYATTDGGMIMKDEVNLAVNKGLGIFVGNYFVGITESYQCYINSPFGRFS